MKERECQKPGDDPLLQNENDSVALPYCYTRYVKLPVHLLHYPHAHYAYCLCIAYFVDLSCLFNIYAFAKALMICLLRCCACGDGASDCRDDGDAACLPSPALLDILCKEAYIVLSLAHLPRSLRRGWFAFWTFAGWVFGLVGGIALFWRVGCCPLHLIRH